jgi:hypothetical protein
MQNELRAKKAKARKQVGKMLLPWCHAVLVVCSSYTYVHTITNAYDQTHTRGTHHRMN